MKTNVGKQFFGYSLYAKVKGFLSEKLSYQVLKEKIPILTKVETAVANLVDKIPAPIPTILLKFLHDDFAAIFISLLLAWSYYHLAPFTHTGTGFFMALFFAFMVKNIYEFFQSDIAALRKIGWYTQVGAKSRVVYEIIMIALCTSIVVITFLSAPSNLQSSVYEKNALAWLHEGRCDELAKFSRETSSMCIKIQAAKSNLAEPFVVKQKKYSTGGDVCTYTLLGQKSSTEYIMGNEPCTYSVESVVKLTVEPHYSTGFPKDDYSYTITMK